jgi:predicted PurR-regulated permease PerM
MGPQAMQLQSSLEPIIRAVSEMLGAETGEILDRAFDAAGLETLVRQVVLGLLGLINQFGIVAIYVAFLLVDQQYFPAKLRLLVRDPVRHDATRSLLNDLGGQISAYLWIMAKVSAATAALSFVVFIGVGLENPYFWVVLVFVLNFIPTIGSILGTLLPTMFALVQFQNIGTAALMALALGAVQFTIGNIVLPRMAGRTLNLSLTVTILCLLVWGALWGVAGMFLAVPLTASLLLVAARFESTRPIAIALSQTGEPFLGSGAPPPGPGGTRNA